MWGYLHVLRGENGGRDRLRLVQSDVMWLHGPELDFKALACLVPEFVSSVFWGCCLVSECSPGGARDGALRPHEAQRAF